MKLLEFVINIVYKREEENCFSSHLNFVLPVIIKLSISKRVQVM